jgi:hypothetical protein
VLLLLLVLASPAHAGAVVIKPEQDIAIVMRSHWVFAAPGRHHVGKVWDTTPITGVHTRLPILAYGGSPGTTTTGTGTTTTGNGTPTAGSANRWLLVRLPGRPRPHRADAMACRREHVAATTVGLPGGTLRALVRSDRGEAVDADTAR